MDKERKNIRDNAISEFTKLAIYHFYRLDIRVFSKEDIEKELIYLANSARFTDDMEFLISLKEK